MSEPIDDNHPDNTQITSSVDTSVEEGATDGASEATDKSKKKKSVGSPKAMALAARLRAVQALYQKIQSKQSVRQVVNEFLEHRSDMHIDGEPLVPPDALLFRKIMYGIDERFTEINSIVEANLKKDASDRKIELLLHSIILCATYELLIHEKDAPIIINDYLNIGHSFYERGEVALINGVLDNIAKLFK